MLNVFKRSGAKATNSFKKRFNQSIIKLTLIYATTLAIILIFSAVILNSAFSSRIGRRFSIAPPPAGTTRDLIIIHQPTAKDVREDLINSLILVNSLLLFIAGISSYWLARITLQPIKDAYERQQKFLSDASHELRTPLSILHIELENELHATHKKIEQDQIKSKLEEVQRMSKIVHDLLTLSRLDEGTPYIKTKPKRISLQDTIAHIINRLEPLAKTHDVTLSFISQSNIPHITLDEDLFSHAFTNFIQNAIIYNKPHGEVMVTTEIQSNKVIIGIKDTGIGISPEDLKNILDRFYRTDKSRSRQTGGTGLGLSIAQSAIEHMNGTLTIESELHKNTVVTISLPLN